MSLIGSYSSFVFVSIAIFLSFLFLYNISICSLFSCSLSIHLIHILYVRVLTDTCKLFQSPYYFAALFVLFVIYFELYDTNPITIASTRTTPTVTTIHASASIHVKASIMLSSFMLYYSSFFNFFITAAIEVNISFFMAMYRSWL